jgi:hypothetical protein
MNDLRFMTGWRKMKREKRRARAHSPKLAGFSGSAIGRARVLDGGMAVPLGQRRRLPFGREDSLEKPVFLQNEPKKKFLKDLANASTRYA